MQRSAPATAPAAAGSTVGPMTASTLTALQSIVATGAPHTVPAHALRALAGEALADKDISLLALLAARLDLPADVADQVATVKDRGVQSAWAARPDVQLTTCATDPLRGEKRAAVLSSLLTPTSSAAVRAAVADAFLAKPTTTVACAWLSVPAALVPVEVGPVVVAQLARTRLNAAQYNVLNQWIASLPYGTAPLPGRYAPMVSWWAHFAAPGEDPTNGEQVTTYVTEAINSLIARARTSGNQHIDNVATAINALIAYTRSGRTAPQAALDAFMTVADPDTHSLPRVREHLRVSVAQWVSAGMPGLYNTANAGNAMAVRASIDIPRAVKFTTLRALRDEGAPTLDTHTRATVEQAAAHSTNIELLERLSQWAQDEPAASDGPSTADDPSTADIKGPAALSARRDETAFALLSNPSLPPSSRDQLLNVVKSWPAPRILANWVGVSVTHLLEPRRGDVVDGDLRVRLYLAGSDHHAHYPLSSFTDAERATIVTALAAHVKPTELDGLSTGGQRGVTTLLGVLADPATPVALFGQLSWTLLAKLALAGQGSPVNPDALSVAARRARTWLLDQTSAVCAATPAAWTVAAQVLDLHKVDDCPAQARIDAVTAALT